MVCVLHVAEVCVWYEVYVVSIVCGSLDCIRNALLRLAWWHSW